MLNNWGGTWAARFYHAGTFTERNSVIYVARENVLQSDPAPDGDGNTKWVRVGDDPETIRDAGVGLIKTNRSLAIRKPSWLSSLWGRPNADDDDMSDVAQAMRLFHLESQDTRGSDNTYTVPYAQNGLTLPVITGRGNPPNNSFRQVTGFNSPRAGSGPGEYDAARPGFIWRADILGGRFQFNGQGFTQANAGTTTRRIDMHVVVEFPPGYFDADRLVEGLYARLIKSNTNRWGAEENESQVVLVNRRRAYFIFRLEARSDTAGASDQLELRLAYQHEGGTQNLPVSAVQVNFTLPSLSLTQPINFPSSSTVGAAPDFRGAIGDIQLDWVRDSGDDADDVANAFAIIGPGGRYIEAIRDLRSVHFDIRATQNTHADAAGTAYLWREISGVLFPEIVAQATVPANGRWEIAHVETGVIRGERFFVTMDVASPPITNNGHLGNPRFNWDARPNLGGSSNRTVIPGLIRRVEARPSAGGKNNAFTIQLPDSATPDNMIQAKLFYESHLQNQGSQGGRLIMSADLPARDLLREGSLLAAGAHSETLAGINQRNAAWDTLFILTVNANRQATINVVDSTNAFPRYIVDPYIELVHG